MNVVDHILAHHDGEAVGMTLSDDEVAEVADEIERLRSAIKTAYELADHFSTHEAMEVLEAALKFDSDEKEPKP